MFGVAAKGAEARRRDSTTHRRQARHGERQIKNVGGIINQPTLRVRHGKIADCEAWGGAGEA